MHKLCAENDKANNNNSDFFMNEYLHINLDKLHVSSNKMLNFLNFDGFYIECNVWSIRQYIPFTLLLVFFLNVFPSLCPEEVVLPTRT